MTVTVISFGHLYGPAPAGAHLAVDLREGFRNPAPHLPRDVVFPDEGVREHVRSTPGIPALVDALVAAADTLATAQPDVVVALGCAGGHHRAPSTAAEVADRLTQRGRQVDLVHRDLDTEVETAPASTTGGSDNVDIDDPIEMPEGATDFALPTRPRSNEDPDQARARLEALAEAWRDGFSAPELGQALADAQGLTRTRSWILTELRRLEDEGRLECDDSGRWHPTTSA